MSGIADNRSHKDSADGIVRVPSPLFSTPVASLYESAITGSVMALEALLEQYGNVILYRISLTSFNETPLHLAALMGHFELSKRLLELRPELASEQDSEKCTPLHLAAANGHDKIVVELLKAYGQACLVQDQDGRVTLHLATMRGRLDVVRVILSSAQGRKSAKEKASDGDSILHMSVRYNGLDILKLVIGKIEDEEEEILMMKDSQGDTVLHLAVMLKQIEAVRFLLELTRAKKELINARNEMNFTVHDVLNQSRPRGDFKSQEIRDILLGATAGHGHEDEGKIKGISKVQQPESRGWKARVWPFLAQVMEYKGDWMKNTKGSLMMVASIIATVTFQTTITPPGGVWQEDYKPDLKH